MLSFSIYPFRSACCIQTYILSCLCIQTFWLDISLNELLYVLCATVSEGAAASSADIYSLAISPCETDN